MKISDIVSINLVNQLNTYEIKFKDKIIIYECSDSQDKFFDRSGNDIELYEDEIKVIYDYIDERGL